MKLFEHATCQSAVRWVTVQEIDSGQIYEWRELARSCGIYPDLTELRTQSSADSLTDEKYAVFHQMIPIVREIVDSLLSNSTIPFLYFLTDQNGILRDHHGTQETVDRLDGINLKLGTSFALADAGINAISLSMHTQERIYLRGPEHDLQLFHDWACICSPIVVDGEIVGYMDFSFHADESPSHAMMVLAGLVDVVQDRLSTLRGTGLDGRMDVYKLSSREKEVARSLHDNRSVLYIAENLGIKEGTVRNFIKNIYRKMKVQSRGEFFKKLLIDFPSDKKANDEGND